MSEINPVKPNFSHSFRDILAGPAQAFQLKKIFTAAVGLVLGWICFDLLTFLAFWLDGLSPDFVFKRYSLFPFDNINLVSNVAQGLYWLGVAGFVFFVIVGFIGVGILQTEELRGNRLIGAGRALKFAFSRIKQLFLSYLTIGAFAAVLVATLLALGALARVPWIGETVFSIFFVIPGFLFALVLALTAAVSLCGLLLTPSVIAADRDGETFTTLLETFSTLIRRPFQWIGYTLYSGVSAKLGVWALACASIIAIKGLLKISTLAGGENVQRVFNDGASHIPLQSATAEFVTRIWPSIENTFGISLALDLSRWGKGGDDSFAGFVLALGLLIIALYVVSYGLSIIATIQINAYIILRHKRDDYDVTAENPLYMSAEWINPPIEKSASDYIRSGRHTGVESDEEKPAGVNAADEY